MSDAYRFAIGKSRALVLAGCFVVAAILLFLAGALSGMLYSNHRVATALPAIHEPVAKTPQAPAMKPPLPPPVPSETTAPATPAANPPSTATAANPPSQAASAPASAPVAGPAPAPSTASALNTATKPSAPPPLPGADAKSQPAQNPAPIAAEVSYAIPLAVQVGSFTLKSEADTLIQSLKDMGYQPALSHYTDVRGRARYVVKLGPYTQWNAASQVATRVSLAEDVSPVIGPMQ